MSDSGDGSKKGDGKDLGVPGGFDMSAMKDALSGNTDMVSEGPRLVPLSAAEALLVGSSAGSLQELSWGFSEASCSPR